MRQLFLAALGVFAVAGVASAQQPNQYAPPAPPSVYTASAAASIPSVYPASGTTYLRGAGCTNCGVPAVTKFAAAPTAGCHTPACQTGAACNSGCGSVKSDCAFHFGSCKGFFSPCGPTCGHGHLGGNGPRFGHCPILPLAAPYGEGWHCPRQYDSHANH